MNVRMIATVCFSLLFPLITQAITEFKCAGDVVVPDGARINLNRSESGLTRANLIFGTTVSGTMYAVTEVSPGIFEGSIKGKSQFWIKLVISPKQGENRFIRGNYASLEVVYPDITSSTGYSHHKSQDQDDFICGKQINRYRK